MLKDNVNSGEEFGLVLNRGGHFEAQGQVHLPEGLMAKGEVTFEMKDADGNVVDTVVHRNLVVNAGLAFITSRMIGVASAVMSHMGLGSGTTAAAATQTALVTQLGRVALDSQAQVTTTVANDSVQYIATFPAATATGAVTEAALFNAASGGTMLARTVFPVVNKGAADSITVTWKITLS